MIIDDFVSNEAAMRELGQRLRSARIAYPLTQAQLAERAGVSLRTIVNLEKGSDATLGSLIGVMRALGQLSRMNMLFDEVQVRPSELLAEKPRRQRVRAASASRQSSSWKWGDEQ